MARVFTESFEAKHFLAFSSVSGGTSFGAGLDGSTWSMSTAADQQATFLVSGSEFYIGAYFKSTVVLGNLFPFQWHNGANEIGFLRVNTGTGILEACTGGVLGGAGTVYSSSKVLSSNVTYHIQLHVVISDTVGVFQIKVDDVVVLNQTNIDTKPGAFSTIDRFTIGRSGNANLTDSVCCNDTTGAEDNSWPGIVRFVAKVVQGPGAYVNNWSRNTGADNWDCVEEIPPDNDTTYLFTSSASTYESFSMNNPVISFANFRALRTMAVVKKDTGTVKLAVGLRDLDNSTDYYAAAVDVGVDYSMVQDRRTLDPSTSMSWTQAGLGNVQALIISSG